MNNVSLIRPELLTLSGIQLRLLLPYLVVFLGSIVAILLSVVKVISPKWPVIFIVAATCLVSGFLSSELLGEPTNYLFNNMMIADRYSNFFNVLFLCSAAMTLFASIRYLDGERLQYSEYYILLLFSCLGMMLMVSALDLIVIFISLEIMSLCVYALVGFRRADRKSNEAAMKYFILGSAASAVFLYGAALLYGSTGSTQIRDILHLWQGQKQIMTPVFYLGVWLVLLGFLFKVAAVPFHMWMPDVYEGAPAPVTGFMTTGLKAAAFATLVRIYASFGTSQEVFHNILWIAAALTMVIGNIIALTQANLKRMLAYSSIAHSGYLLVGILAGPKADGGYASVTLYLFAYAAMNLGAFVILTIMAGKEDRGLNLHDMAGLASRRPWLAFALSVFLLSMAGIPPTAGFAAKYMLFYSAIQAGETPLVVIAVLCSALSVYYYLRVLVYMYMREPVGEADLKTPSIWAAAVATAMVLVTLEVGVFPSGMITAAKKAVASLNTM